MLIIPAIDIKDGKVVRLFKGNFDHVTEYGSNPLEMAHHWVSQGAKYLHLVDLDGAKDGGRGNRDVIKQIAKEIKVPIEAGGGIRDEYAVQELLEAGVDRVVMGTKVIEDRAFLGEMLKKYSSHIAVSLDCHNGFVAQRGWVETSSARGVILAAELAGMGLQYMIYTDIARDGTLSGPNIKGLKEMLAVPGLQVIASGGVKDIDDIRSLLMLNAKNLYGVITGKAIYEGVLNIKEALRICLLSE